MPKISELPALTTAANSDVLAIVDTAGAATKKITKQNLLAQVADGTGISSNAITTAKIANGSITNAKLATGATRIGVAKLASNATLSTTNATYLTVTGTSTGRECEVHFFLNLANGNSGDIRVAYIKVQRDGVDINPTGLETVLFNVPGITAAVGFSFVVSDTPAAGSHTWTLQLRASSGSAVVFTQGFMKVTEIA